MLGVGGYFLYQWNHSSTRPQAVTVDVPNWENPQDAELQERTVNVQPDRQQRMIYLLSGLALLLLGSGGLSPLLRIFSGGNIDQSANSQPARTERLSRPDGSELHIEHVGPEQGPIILFTHGWSLDRSDWDGVRAEFGDRYHLVFWDLAGLGQSTAPRNADHSLDKMAADLEAVLQHVTQGPAILVGHSIGGMIQQTFCRLFPQHLDHRVRGLVFVHTTYTNPAKTALGSPILTALQKPILEPLTHLMIWLAPLMWLSNWQSYWNGSLHVSTRLTSFAGKQTWKHIDHGCRLQARAWPAVVGRGMLAMTRFDEQEILPRIKVPALVIAGRHDRLTKHEASQFLAQQLPQAKLVTLDPAGHFGLWEQSADFHAALATFADSLSPQREPSKAAVPVS